MDSQRVSAPDIAHWIQIPALALLVGIADHGSLSAGARAISMAQPNASRALKSLERRLGYPLVVRQSTGSTLTAEGVLTVQWARKVLEGLEELSSGARSLAQQGQSVLQFGASMTVAEYLAPGWIGTLHRQLPSLSPRMKIMNSREVIAAVQRGDVDFGFVETPRIPAQLRAQQVYSDEMFVVAPPSHPWAHRKEPLSQDELLSTALVEREEGSGTRAFLDVRAHSPRPRPIAEFKSNATVCQCVVAGMGPAVLSQLAVASQLELGNLVRIPYDGPALTRELRMIWAPGHVLGPAELALQDIAKSTERQVGTMRDSQR